MEKIKSHWHISVLGDYQIKIVQDALHSVLGGMNLEEDEYQEVFENGMNGRLCDLEEVLNVNELIKKIEKGGN